MNKMTCITKEKFASYCAGFTLTAEERTQLDKWVQEGNNFLDNPWYMAQENGQPLDFVNALRVMLEQAKEHGT